MYSNFFSWEYCDRCVTDLGDYCNDLQTQTFDAISWPTSCLSIEDACLDKALESCSLSTCSDCVEDYTGILSGDSVADALDGTIVSDAQCTELTGGSATFQSQIDACTDSCNCIPVCEAVVTTACSNIFIFFKNIFVDFSQLFVNVWWLAPKDSFCRTFS